MKITYFLVLSHYGDSDVPKPVKILDQGTSLKDPILCGNNLRINKPKPKVVVVVVVVVWK